MPSLAEKEQLVKEKGIKRESLGSEGMKETRPWLGNEGLQRQRIELEGMNEGGKQNQGQRKMLLEHRI